MNRQSSSRIAALALFGAMILTACAQESRSRSNPLAKAPAGPRRVGTVALVNEELSFVLIDVGSLYSPQVGTALKSFSGGMETGILAVNPEKQRPFIVADIVKGEPKVGDEVKE